MTFSGALCRAFGPAIDCVTTQRIQAVCLDIDDTLIDFTSSARLALCEMIGRDDMWARWERTTEEHLARVVSGELDVDAMRQLRTKAFIADLGALLDDEVIADMEAARLATMRSSWRLYGDVLPFLRWVREMGLPISAVTNASGAHQRQKLADLGIAEFFDDVVIAGETGAAKPDPVIFHTACHRLGVLPGQAAHIGDRLGTDAVGARDAGLHGIWLNRDGQASRTPTGVHTVTSLDAVPDLLINNFGVGGPVMPAQRGLVG